MVEDAAEWAQAASGVILLGVTYWYTRLNTRIVASQVAPYVALNLWGPLAEGQLLDISVKNAGRGPALDLVGSICFKRWQGQRGEDVVIDFQAPIVDAGEVLAVPSPASAAGLPLAWREAYSLFEYVQIEAQCKDQRGKRRHFSRQYRLGRMSATISRGAR